MNHDEVQMLLLEAIANEYSLPDYLGGGEKGYNALRAVVELHKPQEITLPDGEWGANCIECDGYDYPCPTIQTIEKEL
jgi:hypothetical protein